MRALRTRFFDVPWQDLMQVVDAPDHHPQIAQIFDWAQLAQRAPTSAVSPGGRGQPVRGARARVGGGERALTNTWHLIELCSRRSPARAAICTSWSASLRRWIADDTSHPDERDVQRAETDADAVRVLTIHKAKASRHRMSSCSAA